MSTPSFQFYPKQWLGDNKIAKMSFEARGVHLQLICMAWQENPPCSIPDDDRLIVRLLGAGSSRKLWLKVKRSVLSAWRFQDDRWYQDGLLKAYRNQRNKKRAGAANGRQKTEQQPSPNSEQLLQVRDAPSSSSSTSYTTPLTPQGGNGQQEQRAPRPPSDPFEFADWFFAEALGLELLGIQEPGAHEQWVRRELAATEKLLANGVDECQRRARRYLVALKSGELTRKAPTLRGLLSAWDFGCVRTDAPTNGASRIYTPTADEIK